MDQKTLDEEKRLYERFWALLGDASLMMAFAHFGPSVFRRSSVLEGFEAMLQTAGEKFKGGICLEIGTLKGLTAAVLSRYFDRVISVDIIHDPQRDEVADLLQLKNVEFVIVPNNKAKAELVSSLKFDAAYVDGDHISDTESDFALVQRCGRVLFHEHWEAQPAVINLLRRLRAQGDGVIAKGKFALWTA